MKRQETKSNDDSKSRSCQGTRVPIFTNIQNQYDCFHEYFVGPICGERRRTIRRRETDFFNLGYKPEMKLTKSLTRTRLKTSGCSAKYLRAHVRVVDVVSNAANNNAKRLSAMSSSSISFSPSSASASAGPDNRAPRTSFCGFCCALLCCKVFFKNDTKSAFACSFKHHQLRSD